MNWLNLILAAAAFLSTAGVFISALKTYRRVKAEKGYLAILQRSTEAQKLRRMHSDYLADGKLSNEELAHLVEGLEQLAKRMPAEDRVYIMNALTQNSARGRERYIEKVIRDSVAA